MRSYKNLASELRPRSVKCVHKPWLTPRMKHTRVPRTVRRDIWRLAIETSSIPSFHIFRSWIRNQIERRIEDRKKPNGPNRKSNRLTKKQNSTYLVPRWIITRADWCGAMFAQASNLLTKTTLPWKFNLPHAILDQTSLFLQNLYQHQSALPYMGCCTLSSCSSNKGPRILGPTIQ